jgi:hypothetical protein
LAVSVRLRIVAPDEEDTILPPGQRDLSGFWYPIGYSDPKSLVRRRMRRHSEVRTVPRPRRSREREI